MKPVQDDHSWALTNWLLYTGGLQIMVASKLVNYTIHNICRCSISRPICSSKGGGGFFCLQSGTLHMHTYLIIVIKSLSIRCAYVNKRKLKLNRRLINILVMFKLSHEAFDSCLLISNVCGCVYNQTSFWDHAPADRGTSLLSCQT